MQTYNAPDRQLRASAPAAPRHIRVGKYRVPVPRSKLLRVALGIGLILGGILPLVPPGASGVPLGVTLLSLDYPKLRRPRRRMVVWGGRKLKSVVRLFANQPAQ